MRQLPEQTIHGIDWVYLLHFSVGVPRAGNCTEFISGAGAAMFPVLCKHLVEAAGWNAALEDLEPDDHVFREIERISEIGTNEKTQGYFREVERDGMAAGHGVLEKNRRSRCSWVRVRNSYAVRQTQWSRTR